MQESDVEAKFRKQVKKAGGKAYKFVSPGNRGVPDRLVVFPGARIGFVELKAPGKKPRKDQIRQMELLKSLGFYVSVVDRMGDIDRVIREIKASVPGDPILTALEAGGIL